MVNRYYICDNCSFSFEHLHKSMHEEMKKKCPQCGKSKLYQDLSGQQTLIYKEPLTIGHQAERNTARAGVYELEDARSKTRKTKTKHTPWYNTDGTNLKQKLSHLNTNEKKQKYIMTGEL
jgi:DNA-directed RNA polymerase subunit RPC12/RpoP